MGGAGEGSIGASDEKVELGASNTREEIYIEGAVNDFEL